MILRFYTHIATVVLLLLLLLPGWLSYGGDTGILSQNQRLLYSLLIRSFLTLLLGLSCFRLKPLRKVAVLDYLLLLLLPLLTIALGVLIPAADTSGTLSNNVSIVLLVAISITAAFNEELFFRSWLLEKYEQSIGSIAVVLLSSCLFASIHLWQGPPVVIFSFFIGVLYAGVYLKFRNVWILIGAHSIHNVLAILLSNIR